MRARRPDLLGHRQSGVGLASAAVYIDSGLVDQAAAFAAGKL
ncbi:hypothetical protein [Mycobacterium tilburgii]|nr:hypothetical protein [Mycobacterium tilburgii]